MAGKKWDGLFHNLRVSEAAHPELYQELASMQSKERGDRLRSLALIGLLTLRNGTALRGGALGEAGPPGGNPDEQPIAASKLQSARSSLKGKLLSSV